MKKDPEQKDREFKKPFYLPEDYPADLKDGNLTEPGQFPFTRGVYREMYRKRLWTMRQYSGYGSALESNNRFRHLLDKGITGLSVAFDLPTQIGLDSDSNFARGEVGRVGVAIDSVEDMERLFQSIPLAEVSTSMTINSTAAILLSMYLVVASKQGADWKKLRGTIQNDILKEYIARGTFIFPPGPSLRLVTDTLEFCQAKVPHWNAISVSGYHIREAGATAAQEIAFTLSNGETYLREAQRGGIDLETLGNQVSFFFSCHNNFFEEIAKFRAARKLWAELVRNEFGIQSSKAASLRFHTQTAGSTLTAQQPENNTVRVAYQALAAVLGGTQSLHTNAWDEALALPTDESATLALRTQQILGLETGVTEFADPLGGSWYLEAKTAKLAEEAAGFMEDIRELGGMVNAIAEGYVQKQIQNAAWDYQQKVESNKIKIVGLNEFKEPEKKPVELLKIDPEIEERQIERLRKYRETRNQGALLRSLEKLRKRAAGTQNLLPSIIEAVEIGATVGEISSSLKDVFGEYQETVVL